MFLFMIWEDIVNSISVEVTGNNDLLSDKQINKILKHGTLQWILLLYNERYKTQYYMQKYQFTIKQA